MLDKGHKKLMDKAHKAVSKALLSGKLDAQPCCICGKLKVQPHHEDYTKPLDIVWLCPRHHQWRHSELRNGGPPSNSTKARKVKGDDVIKTRVRREIADKFRECCARLGITQSRLIRDFILSWIKEHK